MSPPKDVKRSTVDEITRRIVVNKGLPVEKAKQIAVDLAEKVNRKRNGEK